MLSDANALNEAGSAHYLYERSPKTPYIFPTTLGKSVMSSSVISSSIRSLVCGKQLPLNLTNRAELKRNSVDK